MIKYILALLLLSGCGSSSTKTEAETIIKQPEPVKEAVYILNNQDNKTLNQLGYALANDYKHVLVNATYDQADRQRVANCNYTCFYLNDSVILGKDMNCDDCIRLITAINYASESGISLFVVVNDELTFSFAESIASSKGFDSVVFLSESIDILSKAQYNYPLGLINYSNQELNNIDFIVTSDIEDCSMVTCIASESTDKSNKGFDYAIINHE